MSSEHIVKIRNTFRQVMAEELTPREYQVFWLYCCEGASQKQIANALDLDPGRVCRLVNAARNKIRKRFFFERDDSS